MMKKILYLIMFIITLSSAFATEPWSTTDLDDAENTYEQALALNDLFDGAIGVGFVLVVFLITLVVTTANTGNILAGSAAASFVFALSSIILNPLGFVGFSMIQISVLMIIITVGANILLGRR